MQSDEALEAINGEVLEILVSNHAEFKKFLRKRMPSPAAADDLLQQCLAKAVEKKDELRDNQSVVAWFYSILRNALIDTYRARASENEKYASYLKELTTTGADRVAALDDELEAAVCACMTRLLPTLKFEYGDVLRRVDLEGASLAEVAEEFGTTVNNLTVRLHRARRALKDSLVRSCGTCTEHGCLDCSC
ncbi:MAG TPA: sigma-70 family RNA polymerase sigma factor [Oligoflexia bacterium]|nr:sigma-70 family RNA polymerase sigma factor [Oligoflexia bacterium]